MVLWGYPKVAFREIYAVIIATLRCYFAKRTKGIGMDTARRRFLRGAAGILSLLVGGRHLSGCLGGSGASDSGAALLSGTGLTPQVDTPPPTSAQPAPQIPSGSSQQAADSGPVWQPSPTIEFVEGIPAAVSVSQFVQDPDRNLVIQLASGAFLPGITWNPANATIVYDGRPLGAKPQQPVVVTGITFTARDGKQ